MAVHKNETIDCTKKTLLFCFPVGNPKTKMKIFFYLKALGGGGILFSFKEKLEKLNKFSEKTLVRNYLSAYSLILIKRVCFKKIPLTNCNYILSIIMRNMLKKNL